MEKEQKSKRKKNMTVLLISVALVMIVVGAGMVWYALRPRGAQGCNPPLPREALSIGASVWNVEIASTTTERTCGLSGRTGLGEHDGMLFLFDSSSTRGFWMKDMNFPIDMVWIGGDTVLGFAENAPPQPGAAFWALKVYTSPGGTDKVLEVPAGSVAKYGIKEGDTVKIGG